MRLTIRLRTVLIILSLLVLALPVAGIQVLRLYESALVRQTESSLIAQGVFITAFYRALFHNLDPATQRSGGLALPEGAPAAAGRTWRPRPAQLDLADSPVLAPFPDGYPAASTDASAQRVAEELTPVLKDAQLETLAAIRVVDHQGVVVATTGESLGRNLSLGEEVRRALAGEYVSRLRRRTDVEPSALSSISRSTGIRVFVAVPVVIDRRMHGAVLLSRTPASILQALYGKRYLLLQAAGVILAVMLAVALFVSRLIARPLARLADGAESIAQGGTNTLTEVRTPRTREIARLQASIVAMARTLEQRAAYVSEFSRQVSHEFKTPLTAIRGTVEVLRDHGEDMTSEEFRRFLGNVEADAERLHRLTQRLLDLARADMASFATTSIEVAAVTERLLAERPDKGICVRFDRPAAPLVAECSQPVLDAVLDSLLDNAAEHGGTTVRISLAETGERIEICVTDDGPGISPANRPRIFEPFFTTARARGGTGLGLTIAAALLQRSGGAITLADDTKGASFVISLPRADADAYVTSRAGVRPM